MYRTYILFILFWCVCGGEGGDRERERDKGKLKVILFLQGIDEIGVTIYTFFF